ncbi:MAG: hypothetical protein ACLSVD_13070 [Eggerthellaceae bacterium]
MHGCLQCYLYCPDGTVYKVPSACQPTEAADAAASPAPDLAAMPKARVPKYASPPSSP